MLRVHSNYSVSFLSPVPCKPRKHHYLLFPSFNTSFLSPSSSTTFPRNKNVSIQLSLEKKSAPSISVGQSKTPQSGLLISASDVVRNFYGGINRHDLAAVAPLIAQNCVYEDLIFSQPFVGRKSILEFFGKFIDYVNTDLQFVIDAISEEDSLAVGVTWHLEWKGRPFPFSKGCSFYQLQLVNGIRQIIYARDSVEPAFKPGESALVYPLLHLHSSVVLSFELAIRGVTWLLQRFPKLLDWL